MPESSDPYLYPGTDVLRNLADLRDPVSLAAFEANATVARGAAPFLEAALTGVLAKLATERYLSGLQASEFADRAGYYFGEINAAPPFREGNGRTQREFVRQLCWKAGFPVDWSVVTREETIAASRGSCRSGDSSGLGVIVAKAIRVSSRRS